MIFRFPLNNPKLLNIWLNKVKRKNFKPTKFSSLCSEHFTPEDYQLRPGADVKLLKTEAFPTVFKGLPSYLQDKLPVKRRILQRSTVNICYILNNTLIQINFV